MTTTELLSNYQDKIVSIYKEHDLKCLRGIDNKYELDGKPLLSWYFDATRKLSIANSKFDSNANCDDLLFISDEIMYFTAHLYLYKPYLNNPIHDSYYLGGGKVFPNFINISSRRYYMFADVAFQKIFNYWDRIGNLIAAFFPEEFKNRNIHFTSTIDKIESSYQDIPSIMWLKDYRQNGFKELNEKRRSVVHRSTTDTVFKHSHLKKSRNEDEIRTWMNERNGLPDYFKSEIGNTFKGLINALYFAEVVTDEKLSHIN